MLLWRAKAKVTFREKRVAIERRLDIRLFSVLLTLIMESCIKVLRLFFKYVLSMISIRGKRMFCLYVDRSSSDMT